VIAELGIKPGAEIGREGGEERRYPDATDGFIIVVVDVVI